MTKKAVFLSILDLRLFCLHHFEKRLVFHLLQVCLDPGFEEEGLGSIVSCLAAPTAVQKSCFQGDLRTDWRTTGQMIKPHKVRMLHRALLTVNLLRLSPVCGYVPTCFRYKHRQISREIAHCMSCTSCTSTMPHRENTTRQQQSGTINRLFAMARRG